VHTEPDSARNIWEQEIIEGLDGRNLFDTQRSMPFMTGESKNKH